jgi:hypothetical protein
MYSGGYLAVLGLSWLIKHILFHFSVVFLAGSGRGRYARRCYQTLPRCEAPLAGRWHGRDARHFGSAGGCL